MSEVTEKVAYLRGLADGLGLSENTPVEKVVTQMLETLELMAEQMELLETAQQETLDYVESVDESVAELEELFYEDDDFDEDDACACCEGCDGCAMQEEEEDPQEEE